MWLGGEEDGVRDPLKVLIRLVVFGGWDKAVR